MTTAGNRATVRARQLLSELPALPEPWDVHAFVARVAEHRQRRICCAPTTMSQYASVASGLWVRQPGFDLIAYDATASALHQENTILPELGHLVPHGLPAVPPGDRVLDVAVKLHGHCDREVHERTYSTALSHGQEHYSALATAEAVVLHRALDRARRTREFLPEDRRIRPGEERTRTLAHNIEWWRRVGHAWNSPLTRFLVTRNA